MPPDRFSYNNTTAVLAKMHAKERVIAPLLARDLGLRVELAFGLNSDRLGIFSREIERKGSPLNAARAKIAAAFEMRPMPASVSRAKGVLVRIRTSRFWHLTAS